jgi:hypothetical protein
MKQLSKTCGVAGQGSDASSKTTVAVEPRRGTMAPIGPSIDRSTHSKTNGLNMGTRIGANSDIHATAHGKAASRGNS